jgi:cytochrome c
MPRLPIRLTGAPAALIFAAALMGGPAAQAADPAHGKSVFEAQCAMCHTDNKGGPTILGPNLYGVVGRKAGSLAGYSYSSAMKSAGIAWTNDTLRTFLPAPRAVVAGTRMTFPGLHNPAQLADLIAYLQTLK